MLELAIVVGFTLVGWVARGAVQIAWSRKPLTLKDQIIIIAGGPGGPGADDDEGNTTP